MRTVAPFVALVALLALAASSAQAKTAFVQDQRVDSLTLQYSTDTFAQHNAFGTAVVGSSAQSAISSGLASAVADGSLSWMFEMRDLSDLSGTTDPSFNLSVFNPTPVAGAGYDGTSDLDWWYLPGASELNPDGSAKQQLPASFVAKALSAGPGDLNLPITFAGASMTVAMSDVKIQAVAGTTSAPKESSNGSPPGHLPGEYVDPSLVTFGTMSGGKLSGNISARSLSNGLVPLSFTGSSCNNSYTIANTILDVFVGGCKALGLITEINATQPDAATSSGTGTYVFTADASHHVVSCTHNGAAATLSDCLDGAAYSSYFQFTTDRVIDQLEMADGKLLTVATAGTGSGTVTDSPQGLIDCGSDCSEPYDAGTQVTLEAAPDAGSAFTGWTACDTPTGATCVVTMDADKSVAANFVAVRTLTVTANGSGNVSSSPAGIDCGALCAAQYDDGTPVKLTATPASGFHLSGWTGDCSGTGQCALTMSADHAVTAAFTANVIVQCHVPNVKGKPLAGAKTAIARAHCAVGRISKAYSATVKSGRVISQAPKPGAIGVVGSKVGLKVSKGKKP